LLLLAAAVATLAISGCRQPDDPLARGLAVIDQDALLTDVATLAAPEFSGRLSGSAGYEAAARWAARRFGRLGLQSGGDNGHYLQHLTIEHNEILGTPELTLTLPDGEVVPARLGRDFTCRGFTGKGEVTAEVVFVGYGLSAPDRGYDDYAGVDVEGKVVLMFKPDPGWAPDSLGWDRASGLPRSRARTAREHGARAVLWCDVPGEDRWAPYQGPIGSVLHGPGEHVGDVPHLELDVALAARILGGEGAVHARRARIDSLQAPWSGPTGVIAHVAVDAAYDPQRETCNVVGILPGSDPQLRQQALVLGAHLDHVGRQSPEVYFPGANDNASGSAAILRLAEAFTAAGRAPRRSVVFVLFAGEESGLVGARHHAANPAFPPERTVAMFNLDCIAVGDSIRIGGGESAPALWDLARELDADGDRRTVAATWRGGGADATPFFERGIPTLYWVTTNSYEHLHRPSDTPQTLDGPLFTDLVRLAFRTAWTVADAPAAGPPGAAADSLAAAPEA
jgi:hypothetical protein